MNKTGGKKGKRISLRKRINEKCKDCVYDETNGGTWRQQVQGCTVTLCPLYDVRTKSTGKREG